ncbi:MAG: hypothetical protein DHS20C15_00700 [Planctomycetota bacterium]|nr:MAG: hypothetical protein DHS20C15_00700 [Planctomycetota bacterium]
MRDLVVFFLFVMVLPISFMRPWVGVCAFTFLAYNRTQDLTWGFARTLPLSQFIAIAMLLGWLFIEFKPLPLRNKRVLAMVGLLAFVTFSMLLNNFSWELQGTRYTDLVKVILVSLLTGALLTTRERLRQITAVMAVGLGFFGFKNGVMFLLGSRSIIGPGGMLRDNNDFALAMVMNLPLLWYLGTDVLRMRAGHYTHMFLRVMLRGALIFTPLTIVSTGSRGAFLSTSVGALAVAWNTKWKVPALVGIVLIGMLGFTFAPAEYKARIMTIFDKAEEQDGSVQGRFTSWKVAGNMIVANPGTGIGFNRMVKEYNNYTTGIKNEEGTEEHFARVAHNSYLQIWAESGTPAYMLFMGMVVGTVLSMMHLARRARKEGMDWAANYASAIQVSTICYLVGATFLNRAHFDFIYQLVIIGSCLPRVMEHERTHFGALRSGPRIAQGVTVRHPNPFVNVGAR